MITNILPDYLREFASIVEKGTQTVSFMVNCKCQSTKFYLLENEEAIEERAKREEFEKLLKKYNGIKYSDKNGNIILSTKGILGAGKKKYNCRKILSLSKLEFLKLNVVIVVEKYCCLIIGNMVMMP